MALNFGRARGAKRARCSSCAAHVLVGPSGEISGSWTATVDPAPVSGLGEYLGLLEGRMSYALEGGALDRRDRWRIAGHPAGTDTPVVLGHLCGRLVPMAWWAPPKPKIREDGSVSDEPPF